MQYKFCHIHAFAASLTGMRSFHGFIVLEHANTWDREHVLNSSGPSSNDAGGFLSIGQRSSKARTTPLVCPLHYQGWAPLSGSLRAFSLSSRTTPSVNQFALWAHSLTSAAIKASTTPTPRLLASVLLLQVGA